MVKTKESISAHCIFKKITYGFSFAVTKKDVFGKTYHELVCLNGKLILEQAKMVASVFGLNERIVSDTEYHFSKLGVCMVTIKTIGNETTITVTEFDI